MSSSGDAFAMVTMNLRDYHYPGRRQERRYQLVEQVLQDVVPAGVPTVVALQELPGDDWTCAARGLERLADATGLHCHTPVDGRKVAAAVPGGHDRLAFGLAWSAEVDSLPDTFTVISGQSLWHALVMQAFTVDGHQFTAASYHAPPGKGRAGRVHEARVIARTLRRYTGGREIWLGGDWNSPSARTLDGTYYDPDPAANVTDAHRRDWGETIPEIGHPTDRTPDKILAATGFLDSAVATNAPWQPTTGHWRTDPNGPRRLDRILWHPGTGADPDALPSRIVTYTVHNTPAARTASDHLPVRVIARRP